ncbi:MAG: hypothetical protein WBC90_04295 [Albidovulum sp.]
MVKSPKVYVRDSGLRHALLRIGTLNDRWDIPWSAGRGAWRRQQLSAGQGVVAVALADIRQAFG